MQGAEAVNLSLSQRWAQVPEQFPVLMELERELISKEVEITETELDPKSKSSSSIISSKSA